MPVKISATPTSDVRAITLDEYETGRTNFNEHYSSTQTGEVQGQIIPVNWAAFANTITAYLTANANVTEDQVAISFIHCYDQAEEILHYRMKLSKMEPTPILDNGCPVFSLAEPHMWYTIREHNITPCPIHNTVNEEYMNNLLYLAGPEAAVEQLCEDPGKFVRSMTFPWKDEIKQMFIDNGSPLNATLNLASCSYFGNEGGGADVAWPHGMVLYLSVGGTDLLNNDDYITAFNHKGADVSTLCPPMCNAYVVPQSVEQPITPVK